MDNNENMKKWQKEAIWSDNLTNEFIKKPEQNDPVNHPSHYTDGKIEVIDFIEDKQLGFCLGNAVKYISRAGKKDPSKEVEDLEKARWYLDREIEKRKKAKKEVLTYRGYPIVNPCGQPIGSDSACSASGDTDGDSITTLS